jgi:hypothetical protein
MDSSVGKKNYIYVFDNGTLTSGRPTTGFHPDTHKKTAPMYRKQRQHVCARPYLQPISSIPISPPHCQLAPSARLLPQATAAPVLRCTRGPRRPSDKRGRACGVSDSKGPGHGVVWMPCRLQKRRCSRKWEKKRCKYPIYF